MAKQHIVDGEVRPCRARVRKCPKSDAHFNTVEEARQWIEQDLALEHKINAAMGKKRRNPPSPSGKRALTVPLGGQARPSWMEDSRQFSSKAEVIDVIEGEGERLAVVWAPEDPAPTAQSVRSRGYQQRTVSLRSMDGGEIRGYFRIANIDDDSLASAFGDDEWSAFRYVAEFDGSIRYVLKDYTVDVGLGESELKADRWLNASSDEERQALKRGIWRSYTAMFHDKEGFNPSNWREVEPQLTWGSMVSLKEEHAPEREEDLEADLAQLRELCERYREVRSAANRDPYVDYIILNDEYRGKGYGQALYAYGGRIMGELYNQTIKASDTQTEFAQAAWERMLMTSGFSITKVQRRGLTGKPLASGMQLDFRK